MTVSGTNKLLKQNRVSCQNEYLKSDFFQKYNLEDQLFKLPLQVQRSTVFKISNIYT